MAKKTTKKTQSSRTAARGTGATRAGGGVKKTTSTAAGKAAGGAAKSNAAKSSVAKSSATTKPAVAPSAGAATAKSSKNSRAKVAGRKSSPARKPAGTNLKSAKPSVDSSSATAKPKPLPKTKLTRSELKSFRDLLLKKRAELCGDVELLTDEALNNKGSEQGDHSAMPIHMADLGSDNWEQEFTLGLIANEQAVVREIDEALARIQTRTYGVCLATHQPIRKARLLAKPWARYCIDYARAREEGRLP